MGMRTKPAEARARAPVVRLASGERRGSAEEEVVVVGAVERGARRSDECATCWRRALRVEK